jgi:hypothetical protein
VFAQAHERGLDPIGRHREQGAVDHLVGGEAERVCPGWQLDVDRGQDRRIHDDRPEDRALGFEVRRAVVRGWLLGLVLVFWHGAHGWLAEEIPQLSHKVYLLDGL